MKLEKDLKKIKKKLISSVILIGVGAAIAVGAYLAVHTAPKEDKAEILTSSSLEKVVNINELSMYSVVYNGVAQVDNEEKPDKVDYYVAYEATIKAGFNLEQDKINVRIEDTDEEKKRIVVTLPQIVLSEPEVSNLDFMFENKKADNENTYAEALKVCKNDVKNECTNTEAVYQLARQNAESFIKGIITPFIENSDVEYEAIVFEEADK